MARAETRRGPGAASGVRLVEDANMPIELRLESSAWGTAHPKVTSMVLLWLLPPEIRGERKSKIDFGFRTRAAAYR